MRMLGTLMALDAGGPFAAGKFQAATNLALDLQPAATFCDRLIASDLITGVVADI
jgi:hypothetical protein